jgi:type 1 glutamine amidotransferase
MRSLARVAALCTVFVAGPGAQPPAAPAGQGRGANPAPPPECGGRSSNPRTACQSDVDKMIAALPAKAPAKPQRARKILVVAVARGWVHSSIPLAARMMEEMGKKTGAWTATTTWDPAAISAENLKQYDAIFLDSTTGQFLDDPKDPAATEARKKALLEFVRGGKGLVGIHASSDAYHGDPEGKPGPGRPNAALWPEFNRMIGGWFKHHWNDPQLIVVKLDDPKSPINAPFKGQPFEIHDETYTFPMDSWSRDNVHVLTSVDYSKMSDADKAMEGGGKRTDGDYGLCWIRREGKGRMFYEAHGHSERVYAMPAMLEHILAGVQYALGDLKADDAPSVKGGTR